MTPQHYFQLILRRWASITHRRVAAVVCGVTILAGSGCSGGAASSSSSSEKPKEQQPAVAPPVILTKPPAIQPSAGNAGAASPPATGGTMVKAEAGVGTKGQGYGGGIVTEPIHVYFRQREQIEFSKISYAMNLFKATNDRVPNSHEEFMEKIIQENGIALPQLPPEQSYLYDPQTGQLMVQRPVPVSP